MKENVLVVAILAYCFFLCAAAWLVVSQVEADVYEKESGQSVSLWTAATTNLTPGDEGEAILRFFAAILGIGLAVFNVVLIVCYIGMWIGWVVKKLRHEETLA